jgi:hypothetical protein
MIDNKVSLLAIHVYIVSKTFFFTDSRSGNQYGKCLLLQHTQAITSLKQKKLIGNVVLPQIPKHSPIQMRGSNEGLEL